MDAVEVTASDVIVSAVSKEMAKRAAELAADAKFLSDLNVPAKARLVAVLDVSYSGKIPGGGIKVPFVLKNLKAGDVVYVLHRQGFAPYTWEMVGQAVLDDKLTVVGTFTNFSPVMIMAVSAADVTAAGIKAPKTGDSF